MIKRYEFVGPAVVTGAFIRNIEESKDGDWVKWEDYQRLQDQLLKIVDGHINYQASLKVCDYCSKQLRIGEHHASTQNKSSQEAQDCQQEED